MIDSGEVISQSVCIGFTEEPLAAASEFTSLGRSAPSENVPVEISVSEHSPRQPVHIPLIGVNVKPWLESNQQAFRCDTGQAVEDLLEQVVWCRFDPLEDKQAILSRLTTLKSQVLVLELVVHRSDDIYQQCFDLAAVVNAAGVDPTHVFLIPSTHISNSATADYHLDNSAAGYPSYSKALPSARFDYFAIDELLDAGRAAFAPHVKLGLGSATSFTELNRRRPPAGCKMDFVTHSASAIVHDASDVAVMQTLEAVTDVAHTVAQLKPDGVQYLWGPTTIAEGTGIFGQERTHTGEPRRRPMAMRDPRAHAMFGAAWYLGLAAKLFPLGVVDVVVLGDLIGDRGLVNLTDEGTLALCPSYHVVAQLAKAAGAEVHEGVASSEPERVCALGFTGNDGNLEIWLGNLSANTTNVVFNDLDLVMAQCLTLGCDGIAQASMDPSYLQSRTKLVKPVGPMQLDGYSVMRVVLEKR